MATQCCVLQLEQQVATDVLRFVFDTGTARTALPSWQQCVIGCGRRCVTVAALESVGFKFYYVISINSGALIVEVSRSHRHTTLTTDRHPCRRAIRTRNPSSERLQTHAFLDSAATDIGGNYP